MELESTAFLGSPTDVVSEQIESEQLDDVLFGPEDMSPAAIFTSEAIRERADSLIAEFGLSKPKVHDNLLINGKPAVYDVKVCKTDSGLEAVTIDMYLVNGKGLKEDYSKYTQITGFNKDTGESIKVTTRKVMGEKDPSLKKTYLEIGNNRDFANFFHITEQMAAAKILGISYK